MRRIEDAGRLQKRHQPKMYFVERGKPNPLEGAPDAPVWTDDLTEHQFSEKYEQYRAQSNRIGGHLEMLVEKGYVKGLGVTISADGQHHYSVSSPRLTLDGHDLLDTMRSSPVWEQIKKSAAAKGIELTFDAIKALGALALKQVIL